MKINGKILKIPEDKNRGANSLTPTKTCQKFNSSTGTKEANIWLRHYTKPILKRFNSIINCSFGLHVYFFSEEEVESFNFCSSDSILLFCSSIFLF